jgi:starvation-inducible DNA-binding protein
MTDTGASGDRASEAHIRSPEVVEKYMGRSSLLTIGEGISAMKKPTARKQDILDRVRPLRDHDEREIQAFNAIAKLPIALAEDVCKASVDNLNQLIADTMTLRDMYKKHHWQVAGATFYQLHLLYDKHFDEQSEIVDMLAERIQSLGGISIAMAHDVAETTLIPRLPRGRQPVPVQLSRLLHAHEIVLLEARTMARQAAEAGDDGTNDLLVSDVIRTNELQVWFLSEHLVDAPLR